MLSNWILAITLLAALEGVPVEVDQISGDRISGELQNFSETEVELLVGDKRLGIPLADILELRPAAGGPNVATAALANVTVGLVDGSVLTCDSFSMTDQNAILKSLSFGELTVPSVQIARLRYGTSAAKFEAPWAAIQKKESRRDQIVVVKGESLDQLSGVVTEVGPQIKLLLEGDEVSLNTSKVFGVIFSRRNVSAAQKSGAIVRFGGRQQLRAKSIVRRESSLDVVTTFGQSLTLPISDWNGVDFSTNRLVYLSDIEPREVLYTPFYDIEWKYARDTNLDGGPLRLAGKVHRKGLSVHSKTILRYRLNGEYTRFQALLGIDQLVDGAGDVVCRISGDGKLLYEGTVRGADAPVPVSLDLTGVRELELLVDFGGDEDTGDHLDFADARILK